MLKEAFWDRQRSESVNFVVSSEVISHVESCIAVSGEPLDILAIPFLEKGTVLSDPRGEGAFQ